MDNTTDMTMEVIQRMKDAGMNVSIVRTTMGTMDPAVEDSTDIDVEADGWLWNVRLEVIRFGRAD